MSTLVDRRNVHTVRRDFGGIVLFIAAIWLVFVFDRVLPLERLGLVPRTIGGLTGIVTMPFLHGDLAHLIGNSVPLAAMLLLLAGSRANSLAIVTLITLLGGAGLWLFGREALHIGASGLVFGLIAFHIFAGIFERRLRSLLISLAVGLAYSGTLVQGVLPMQRGVSWDGHLLGAVAGMIVAFLTARMLRSASKDKPGSTFR